jgi:hypothetical protein
MSVGSVGPSPEDIPQISPASKPEADANTKVQTMGDVAEASPEFMDEFMMGCVQKMIDDMKKADDRLKELNREARNQ